MGRTTAEVGADGVLLYSIAQNGQEQEQRWLGSVCIPHLSRDEAASEMGHPV